MKTLRKFIVKNFAFGYTIRIGELNISSLRCTRIMLPTFIITTLVIKEITPTTYDFYDYFLMLLSLIEIWIGFSCFGFDYFSLFPVKWNELDDEQKIQYGNINFEKLMLNEQIEYLDLMDETK